MRAYQHQKMPQDEQFGTPRSEDKKTARGRKSAKPADSSGQQQQEMEKPTVPFVRPSGNPRAL
jgi:hypothetical protein